MDQAQGPGSIAQDPTFLLRWDLVSEPDLQQLGRLLLEAGQGLGLPSFRLSSHLLGLIPLVRGEMQRLGMPLPIALRLEQDHLRLYYGEEQAVQELAHLDAIPDRELLIRIGGRLRNATENADPQLLRQRNIEIERYLEEARQRAEAELAQMEALLESRQKALRESIHRAEHDALTGLYNRGAFDEHLEQAVRRAQRQDECLCLLLLDLDKFKEINDTHGHQYGDKWLQRMAAVMRGAVRMEVDEAFRFGGDEFALMVFADRDVARRAAEKVLQGMDGLVSIGGACLKKTDADAQAFTARADAALYTVKRGGRGHYHFAD